MKIATILEADKAPPAPKKKTKKELEAEELATAPIVLDYLKARQHLAAAKASKSQSGDLARKWRARAEALLGAMSAAAQRVALKLSWEAGTGDL
jgi:hypothetical protein